MSSKGGGGGGSSTQTVTNQPPSFQIPFLERVFSEAENLFNQGPQQFFPFSTVTPLAPAETSAQQALLNFAGGPASDTATQAVNTQNFLLNDVLFPESNPALAGTIQGAIDPVFERLLNEALPAIRSEARTVGGQGGTRQGLVEVGAIDRATEDALGAASAIASQGFGQGLEALTRGLALAPTTLLSTGTAPATIASSVGQQQRAFGEALLGDAIQRFNFEQQAPFDALANFARFVGQPVGSTSTGTTEQAGGSTLQNVVGGGLTGAALGGLLIPSTALGGFGPLIAGGLGGLLGLFD